MGCLPDLLLPKLLLSKLFLPNLLLPQLFCSEFVLTPGISGGFLTLSGGIGFLSKLFCAEFILTLDGGFLAQLFLLAFVGPLCL